MNRAGMRGAALLALASMVGCGGGDGDSRSSSSSPPPSVTTTAPTTTTLSPEAAVKAAYLAYWDVVDKVTDPHDPRLDDVATEPILSFDRDGIVSDLSQGISTRQPPNPALNSHRIDHVEITGSEALIVDCFVDGRIAIGADGSIQDDDIVTKVTEAHLKQVDQRWKVSEVSFTKQTAGVSGCAA